MSAFIGIAKVLELTMMSRVTLHRKIKNEEFPAPEKRGKKGKMMKKEAKKGVISSQLSKKKNSHTPR